MIRRKAKEIAGNMPSVKPYYPGNKVIMKIKFNKGSYLNTLNQIYNNKMEIDNEIILKGSSTTEVWAEYWEMKLNVQKKMEIE